VPDRLANRISACALARTCVTEPGTALDQIGPHCLDRIDDNEMRGRALAKRRHDILDRGLGRQFDLGARKPSRSARSRNCATRLLARNVNRAVAAAGERGRNLDQQRRLADAGIAAEEEHGAAHEAAAGDAIVTLPILRRAVAPRGRSSQRLKGKEPPLARHTALWGSGTLLGNRIPLAAGVALALPAAIAAPQFWQTKLVSRRAMIALPLVALLARGCGAAHRRRDIARYLRASM